MNRTLQRLYNLGIDHVTDSLERKRTRLTNIFALVATFIFLLFISTNVILGDLTHATRLTTCMLLFSPVVFSLNYAGRNKLAKSYLMLFSIVVINYIGYSAIADGSQRFNEFMLFGATSFVLVMYDGKVKILFFLISALSAIVMHQFRLFSQGEDLIFSDVILSTLNMSLSFVCIYLYMTIFRKETERNHKKLKELNETKAKLLSIVSHDLQSPIGSLTNVLKVSDKMSQDEFKGLVHSIRNKTQTISFTLDNLLEWVKTQLNGFTITPDAVNVRSKLTDAIRLYDARIESKSLVILNDIPEDLEIKCDPNHLALIFRNLISNAIKFTKNGDSIHVYSSTSRERTELHIADSGSGICSKRIGSLLNNQVNDPTPGTKGELGSGLGLGFCKDLLARNRATFDIKSELGVGSDFILGFPS